MSVTVSAAPVSHAVRVEQVPDPQVPERASRRSYSAKYKAAILAEYDSLDRDGKGALLRRDGLYTSLISEWRKQRDRGPWRRCRGRGAGRWSTRRSARPPGCGRRSPGSRPSWTRPAR